jgi:thymidine kinase
MNNWFFIYGPVKGGKTSKLIDFINYSVEKDYVVINHETDTRYGENAVISHSQKKISAISLNDKKLELFIITTTVKVIFIDEIQFFGENIISALKLFSGRIYFSGLDIDYRGNYFPISQKLMQMIPVGNLVHCPGICCCGAIALYSKLITTAQPNENAILISANDFEPRCKMCF